MDTRRNDFLAGGGEMGERMRALDWSRTPLGPVEGWPQSLRSAVSILLPSKAQIVLFWGPELVTLYNDAYRPVYGAKHPRVLGLPAREAWSEIWDGVLGPLFDGVLRTGEAFWGKDLPFVLERHGFPEETFFDVSYDPVRDESGAVNGIFCIVAETTGRIVGERRLALLRELAARHATARNVRDACRAAMEAIAASPQDMPFALVYLGDELQAATPGAEAARAAAKPEQVKELAIPGGRLVAGLNPQRPFDENYAAFLGLVAGQLATAIANAQAYEEERKRAEALAALDRAKTEFFSNVSHEFRTPLTLMLGPLEDALAGAALPPEERTQIETAGRNARRLLKLVNTLLDFSRIEAGRTEGAFQRTDLAALTGELASQFDTACARAGLRLDVHAPPLGEAAYVDREMWEKIVFNLLSNAFKFTFEGGIEVALKRAGRSAVLTVRDTGTGIPAADLPHVFERFHRVEGARGRSMEGSGIGLALVRELVQLHGGEVRVQSEPGRGTTFTVSLPLGSAHLPAARIGAEPKAGSGLRAAAYVEEILSWLPQEIDRTPAPGAAAAGKARARILLADDNADMRNYARRLLAADYEVQAVGDGESALRAARESRFDLVLSDVMMPKLDGFGLIAALRADERTRTLPVILLSARAGEESRVEGLAAGADDYLAKPFSAKELQARVAARLEITRVRREAEAATREEAQALLTLNRIGMTLAAETDLQRIVQAVTDAGTAVSGAKFGAFFYNVRNEAGESYLLYTISGVPREAFERFGMPRNTAVFAQTFDGHGTLRVADITQDPRYGRNAPHKGMPQGHLPVKSYLAVPVTSRSGEVIGGLFFGHPSPGIFTERAERLVEGIAAQAAVAFDNATLHEQRLQLIGKLQESDRRKDEFLATLSHELRNPLAPLRNSLHLLRASGGGASGIHDMMERQVNHLVRLVDDLLEMSRISRGAFDLRKERVEVSEIARNALETSQPLMQAAGHQVTLELPGQPLWVDGDPVRLAQILANLLNNAAKYTDPGGRIELAARVEGGSVKMSVRDNGAGLAPEALPRLFEMFSRGEPSSGRHQSGLGIGLALSRRLAEMHGGRVEAASEGPGKGSAFTVVLPLSADQRPPPAADPRKQAALTQRRILVVDDNQDAAESLGMVLKFLGGDVRVAHDGPGALAAFDAYDPAVVLLDIGMPGMDGYDVARRIRGAYPARKPVLVALTGWGQDKDRQRARDAGFDRHLIKPVEIGALQALLASLENRV